MIVIFLIHGDFRIRKHLINLDHIKSKKPDSTTGRISELIQNQVGWGTDANRGFGEQPGMKQQLLNLIRSIRTVMRIPLIGINAVVIVFMLVLG